jgi:phosphopentomutase
MAMPCLPAPLARATFADIGQSVASHLGLPAMDYGSSFLN